MRKLGRKSDNRKHLIKNLVTSLIIYEHIETTIPKAKELKRSFDKILIEAKKDKLSSKRKIKAFLTHENAYKKLYEVIIPRYKEEKSGFTAIYFTGKRVGDGAKKALIRLTKLTLDDKNAEKEDKKDKNNKNQDK